MTITMTSYYIGQGTCNLIEVNYEEGGSDKKSLILNDYGSDKLSEVASAKFVV